MDNIFDCNIENFKIEKINDLKIFTCDNFYKYPLKILEKINNNYAYFHKKNLNTLNGKYFEDRRHDITSNDIQFTIKKLENLVKENCLYPNKLLTNITKWKKNKFNDFKNNYWWPHKDSGMTAIIYLNEENIEGTNIYEENKEELKKQEFTHEHLEPWRKKTNWIKKHTIIAKFNRCVIFDALNVHGCSIVDETYFNKYRMNQVIFFNK